MDENDFMECVEQEEDDDFVEEPMVGTDFDFANANDPIVLDEPISQSTHGFLKINNYF